MHPDEYQRMFEQEDTYWWFLGRRRLVFDLIRRYVHTPEPRILDVGCGTGAMASDLTKVGSVVASDLSEHALGFSRRRNLASLCCADAMRLPFRSGSFDIVVALDLLEHLPDDRAAAAEFRRVLAPEGWLFVTVPAYRFLWSGHDLALMHYRRYTARDVDRLLSAAGFRLRKLSYAVTVLFPIVWLVRQREKRLAKPQSSVRPLPGPLNSLLKGVMAVENACLRYTSLPFGVSVVAVACREGFG